jgi:16S rRNA (cytidine1402-2'-O)-methyltransferase
LGEAVAWYQEHPPKGEFVLVVEGAPEVEEAAPMTMEEAIARVLALREEQGLPLKEAARQVAGETGFSKNDLYKGAL